MSMKTTSLMAWLAAAAACVGAVALAAVPLAVKQPSSDVAGQTALSRKDVFGSARLTPVQRNAHTSACVQQLRALPTDFRRLGKGGPNGDRQGAVREEFIVKQCECLVGQLEDRGSTMQFLMAMDVLVSADVYRRIRRPPAFTEFKSQAQQHGMSTHDFEAIRDGMEERILTSIAVCDTSWQDKPTVPRRF